MNFNTSRNNLRNSSSKSDTYLTNIEICETFVLKDLSVSDNLNERELTFDFYELCWYHKGVSAIRPTLP